MKQNVSPTALVAVLVIAVVVILGIASWMAFGRSGAYYGGARKVPVKPPTRAAANTTGPRIPSPGGAAGVAR